LQPLHTDTCSLACTDVLMNPDQKPQTASMARRELLYGILGHHIKLYVYCLCKLLTYVDQICTESSSDVDALTGRFTHGLTYFPGSQGSKCKQNQIFVQLQYSGTQWLKGKSRGGRNVHLGLGTLFLVVDPSRQVYFNFPSNFTNY